MVGSLKTAFIIKKGLIKNLRIGMIESKMTRGSFLRLHDKREDEGNVRLR